MVRIMPPAVRRHNRRPHLFRLTPPPNGVFYGPFAELVRLLTSERREEGVMASRERGRRAQRVPPAHSPRRREPGRRQPLRRLHLEARGAPNFNAPGSPPPRTPGWSTASATTRTP